MTTPAKISISIWSASFTTLVLIGFLIQIYQITELYLKHNIMNTEVVLEMPEEIPPLAFSIRVRYTDILEEERLLRDTNISIAADLYFLPLKETTRAQSLLTIAHIMYYTPTAQEFIEECQVRSINSYAMKTRVRYQCEEVFVISKFYIQ